MSGGRVSRVTIWSVNQELTLGKRRNSWGKKVIVGEGLPGSQQRREVFLMVASVQSNFPERSEEGPELNASSKGFSDCRQCPMGPLARYHESLIIAPLPLPRAHFGAIMLSGWWGSVVAIITSVFSSGVSKG